MDRKTFIQKTAGAMFLALPAYSVVSCSGSDGDGYTAPDPNPGPVSMGDCLMNGTNASIAANHGHSLNVSSADVESGLEKTYSIQGSSLHDHMVTLNSSHFNSLKANNAITVSSTSGDGHTHSVTVQCA